MKNLVDTWLRPALARLPESMVPPSGAAQLVIRNGLRLLGVASPDIL